MLSENGLLFMFTFVYLMATLIHINKISGVKFITNGFIWVYYNFTMSNNQTIVSIVDDEIDITKLFQNASLPSK